MSSIFRFSQRCASIVPHSIQRGTILGASSIMCRIGPLHAGFSSDKPERPEDSKEIQKRLFFKEIAARANKIFYNEPIAYGEIWKRGAEEAHTKYRRNFGAFLAGSAVISAAIIYEMVSPTWSPDLLKEDKKLVAELKKLLTNPLLPEKFRATAFCKRLNEIQPERYLTVLQEIFKDPISCSQLARMVAGLSGREQFASEDIFYPLFDKIHTRIYQATNDDADSHPLKKWIPESLLAFLHEIVKQAIIIDKSVPDDSNHNRNTLNLLKWLSLAKNLPDDGMLKFFETLIKTGMISDLFSCKEILEYNISGIGGNLSAHLLKHDAGVNFLKNEIEKYVQNPALTPKAFITNVSNSLNRLSLEELVFFVEKLFPKELVSKSEFQAFCIHERIDSVIDLLKYSRSYQIRKSISTDPVIEALYEAVKRNILSEFLERKISWILTFPPDELPQLLRRLSTTDLSEIISKTLNPRPAFIILNALINSRLDSNPKLLEDVLSNLPVEKTQFILKYRSSILFETIKSFGANQKSDRWEKINATPNLYERERTDIEFLEFFKFTNLDNVQFKIAQEIVLTSRKTNSTPTILFDILKSLMTGNCRLTPFLAIIKQLTPEETSEVVSLTSKDEKLKEDLFLSYTSCRTSAKMEAKAVKFFNELEQLEKTK